MRDAETAMADPVIALQRVTLRYPTAPGPTLHDVSLRVEPGEFVGIVGSTGSGKSTLLYLLAGVIPHYVRADIQGDVLLYGRPTRELSLARVTEKVGLVLQDPEAQLFNLFVRDELAWGLENRGLPREEIAARIAATLVFFGIEKLEERITYDLSGGEKQRVALAAVRATAPDVYLFDQPTSQLDPIGAAQVIAAIRRLAERHRNTIVMVEDKVDELVEHADRLVLLDRGRIVLDAAPREFCLRTDLLAAAGVRPTQMAELSHDLIAAGVPLDGPPITLDEMVAALRKVLSVPGGDEPAR
ncbi:MAG: ABC transporter ATP-binding protein [Candidatus Rokubacteria bacterium]|nr:ABC transporter ATP-binding protein [Candidatus Rokubacteria bacterium]